MPHASDFGSFAFLHGIWVASSDCPGARPGGARDRCIGRQRPTPASGSITAFSAWGTQRRDGRQHSCCRDRLGGIQQRQQHAGLQRHGGGVDRAASECGGWFRFDGAGSNGKRASPGWRTGLGSRSRAAWRERGACLRLPARSLHQRGRDAGVVRDAQPALGGGHGHRQSSLRAGW